MKLKKFAKPSVLLPIIIGVIIGVTLVILGGMVDPPGLRGIGITAALCLMSWGVYNTGIIKKGMGISVLLLCFGAGGILLSIVLLIEGEFEESPGIALIGVALGSVLIGTGIIMIRSFLRKNEK
jgi:drug/metabolite transporter (DMT)-like permease